MKSVQYVLLDAKLVSSSGVVEASIAINDGKIVNLSTSVHMPPAEHVIDAEDKIVIPGPIDGHVHIGDPWNKSGEERYYKEDFGSASKAAAAGGTTTIVDMPDSYPVVTNGQLLREKAKIGESKSVVDFGLHGGLVPGMDLAGAIQEMVAQGAAGIKIFTFGYEVGGLPAIHEGELYDAFCGFKKMNGLALVHAENDQMIKYFTRKLQEQGRKDPIVHCESRPAIAEIVADRNVVFLGKIAGNRFMIVHTTVPEGVEEVHKARNLGFDAFVETCPQYLYLSEDDVRQKGLWAKCNPPLRDRERIECLWQLLQAGWIDTIASDHSPQTTSARAKEWGDDMWKAEPGLPGVQTMLPLMLDAVSKGRLTICRLAGLVSENPARVFRFYPKKGALIPGSDADLVMIDMQVEHEITDEEQLSGCGWTPFDGWKIHGMPVLVMSRGEIIMQNGQILAKPGRGKFVSPLP